VMGVESKLDATTPAGGLGWDNLLKFSRFHQRGPDFSLEFGVEV